MPGSSPDPDFPKRTKVTQQIARSSVDERPIRITFDSEQQVIRNNVKGAFNSVICTLPKNATIWNMGSLLLSLLAMKHALHIPCPRPNGVE